MLETGLEIAAALLLAAVWLCHRLGRTAEESRETCGRDSWSLWSHFQAGGCSVLVLFQVAEYDAIFHLHFLEAPTLSGARGGGGTIHKESSALWHCFSMAKFCVMR